VSKSVQEEETDELKEVGMRRKKKKEKETKPAIAYLYLIGRPCPPRSLNLFFCFCGHDQKELILHSLDSGFSTSFTLHHWF
jgi:hypothetical protein